MRTNYLYNKVVLTIVLAGGVAAQSLQAQLLEKPNVLFITIDDMNIWAGAFDGVAKTPHIDALAAQGTIFNNAHCVVPASNPSRTALFTGLRPETTGQYTNEGCFRDKGNNRELITLPQYLRVCGYETVSVGKIYHHPRGMGKTPDPYSDPESWDIQPICSVGIKGRHLYLNRDGYGTWHDGEISGYLGRMGIWGPVPYKTEESEEWENTRFCTDYLNEDHDKPFFLACGVFTPHAPHIAPRKYFDLYPLDKIVFPEVPEDDLKDIPQIAKANFSTSFVELMREKGEYKKAIQGYLACMSFADDIVGGLLVNLKKSKYADNTIVVLLTDNGFQLGHKNRWEKYSLWRMATNTPFIIYSPGCVQGQKCERAVSYLDVYPTLLDMLNLQKPEFLEGHTFIELLTNPIASRQYPAVITHGEGNFSVVKDEWNYIRYKDGSEELYDRRTDKGEFKNLIRDKKYSLLMQQLAQYIPELKKTHNN